MVLSTKFIPCALVVLHGEMEVESSLFAVDEKEVIIRIHSPDKFPTRCDTECLLPDDFALVFVKNDENVVFEEKTNVVFGQDGCQHHSGTFAGPTGILTSEKI
jgi:hypothetical protein